MVQTSYVVVMALAQRCFELLTSLPSQKLLCHRLLQLALHCENRLNESYPLLTQFELPISFWVT